MLKGEEDITSEYAASAFVWARDTGNAEADAVWNAAHNGVKEFIVNASELSADAKFTCTLTGTSPDYGTVYVDENMNLIHAPDEADANDTLHLENCILSVETPNSEYHLNGNVLSVVRQRLNGSVTAEAWVYTAAPEKLVEFEYNNDGMCIHNTVTQKGKTITIDYVLNGKRITEMKYGSRIMHFFYDAQGRPAKVWFEETMYTYINNLQGDILGICDNDGKLVVEYYYNVWGELISTIGTISSTLGRLNPFRYRGYFYNEDIGLYYMRNRYYCFTKSRFCNMDTYFGRVGKIYSHNSFAYCRNSPVSCIDSDGMEESDMYRFVEGPYSSEDILAIYEYKFMPQNIEYVGKVYILRYDDNIQIGDYTVQGAADNDVIVIDKRFNTDDPNIVVQNSMYTGIAGMLYGILPIDNYTLAEILYSYNEATEENDDIIVKWGRSIDSIAKELSIHQTVNSFNINRKSTAHTDLNRNDEGKGYWDYFWERLAIPFWNGIKSMFS